MADENVAGDDGKAHPSAGCRLGKSASVKAFEGASHMGILTDDRLIDEVLQIVKGSKSGAWTGLKTRLRKKRGWLQQLLGAGLFRGRGTFMSR